MPDASFIRDRQQQNALQGLQRNLKQEQSVYDSASLQYQTLQAQLDGVAAKLAAYALPDAQQRQAALDAIAQQEQAALEAHAQAVQTLLTSDVVTADPAAQAALATVLGVPPPSS